MSGVCLSKSGGLAVPLMETVDCHLDSLIESLLSGALGQSGWLGPILTSALTIYIALFAVGLFTGHAKVSLGGLLPKLAVIGLVIAFTTRAGAYQTVLADLVIDGPGHLAKQMSGNSQDGPDVILAGLDQVLSKAFALTGAEIDLAAPVIPVGRPRTVREAAQAAASPIAPTNSAPVQGTATNGSSLLKYSALALALSGIGPLVLSKTLLTILLGIGPLFVVLALFQSTRGLFEGWMRTALVFALVPLFVQLLTAAIVPILDPILVDMATTPSNSPGQMRAILMISAVSGTYVLLVAFTFRLATGLTSQLSLPRTARAVGSVEVSDLAQSAQVAHAAPAEQRLSQMIDSVTRSPDLSPTVRLGAQLARDTEQAQGGGTPVVARRPLGQTLRPQTRAT